MADHAFAAPVLRTERGFRMHYVPLPAEVDAALGEARIVVGTLCDVPFRRAVHGRGDGTPRLHFGKTMLAQARLGYGDTAIVELSAAADPDAVHLPAELAAALSMDAEAAARFATFTPGRRRSLGVHVDQAKRPATRERRALELCEKIRTHTLYGDRAS
ncbi:YdeI/OmpD-associated family protein [Rubrivirga sp. IMCC43871]|uniref:YdeI/OmpD-associated family protein n=1 Tax=Rubrivirga sp. IMCC43871 TaxID=3391575 RepID=UPI00399014B9